MREGSGMPVLWDGYMHQEEEESLTESTAGLVSCITPKRFSLNLALERRRPPQLIWIVTTPLPVGNLLPPPSRTPVLFANRSQNTVRAVLQCQGQSYARLGQDSG